MAYVYLTLAIIVEVIATTALKSSQEFSKLIRKRSINPIL